MSPAQIKIPEATKLSYPITSELSERVGFKIRRISTGWAIFLSFVANNCFVKKYDA